MGASRHTTTGPNDRLTADDRREALLDVAKELLGDGDPRKVSMGTVAERAEVTRALVYKHFDNRDDILAALYRREAAKLDRAIRRAIEAAPDGFEPKFRAFVRGVIDSVDTYGPFFVPLRPFGDGPEFRHEQRPRDRRTMRYFTALAVDDLDVDARDARDCLAVLLSGVSAIVARARRAPEPADRAHLEDLYVSMTLAALRGLDQPARAGRTGGPGGPTRSS